MAIYIASLKSNKKRHSTIKEHSIESTSVSRLIAKHPIPSTVKRKTQKKNWYNTCTPHAGLTSQLANMI